MNGEVGYLKLVRKVLQTRNLIPNRTGTNTFSIFGAQLKFSLLNNTLPMMTTKYVSFNHVIKELLWFIKGDTNQNTLEQDGVLIWKKNSSRTFLDAKGLHHYKEYETLGPIYGFQWRHFNAKYVDAVTDYTNQGVDQLQNVINLIKYEPTSRRILMSAWNASCLNEMVLPPCHVLVQFHVNTNTSELSSHLYQRSADLMLGVPYNITSYSLLTHILAHICGLKAKEFIHSFGDVHIYENHIANAKKQLQRKPYSPPILQISPEMPNHIDHIKREHMNIKKYSYHPKLHFDMAI